MFGIIIAGRLVQTDMQQVDETHVIFNIPDADNVRHIVVFMTGLTPFPDDKGGAVYFSWPTSDGSSSWQLLGSISNAKPSAIFKVANLKKDASDAVNPFNQLSFNQQTHLAQIGISMEPLEQLAQLTPALDTAPSTLNMFTEFTSKMCESLFNFTSSFAVTQAQMVPNPSETFVPLSTLQQWYQNFQRRLQQNPNFWKS